MRSQVTEVLDSPLVNKPGLPNDIRFGKKYSAAEEAVQLIKPGDRVFLHGSAATPVHLIKALLKRHAELNHVEFVSITSMGDVDFNAPVDPG